MEKYDMNKIYKKFGLITVFLVFISFFTVSFVSGALTDNINDYWKLSDVNNSLPRNILTNNNTVTFVPGLIDNAGNFTNTAGKFLKVTNTSAYTANENRTINLWIKPTGFSGRSVGDAVLYQLNGNEQLGINISATNITFSRDKPCVAGLSASINYPIPTTRWTMLTIIQDNSAGRVYGYINGSLVVNFTSSGTGSCGTVEPLNLGVFNAVGGAWFNGLIDEVGVWKRVLSPSELTTLYNSGVGNSYPFDNNIILSSNSPINKSYSFNNNNTVFNFTVSAIVGTWNATLWLNNSLSYGSNNSISNIGTYNIYTTNIPVNQEFLWWINVTNGALSNITEKRLFVNVNSGNTTPAPSTSCVVNLGLAYYRPNNCGDV
jgi:hypothetical protein